VGKSIRPKERLTNHMNEKSKCHRTNWLSSLKCAGLKPSLVILEEVHIDNDWREREIFWIAKGKEEGWKLTNNTIGGDGVCGLPEEIREKIRTAWVGRKHKPESLLKIGAASLGRKHSEEWKLSMSDTMKKRDITWGDKISEKLRKLSESDIEKILNAISNGEKVSILALQYGVHRTTISKVKAGTYRVK